MSSIQQPQCTLRIDRFRHVDTRTICKTLGSLSRKIHIKTHRIQTKLMLGTKQGKTLMRRPKLLLLHLSNCMELACQNQNNLIHSGMRKDASASKDGKFLQGTVQGIEYQKLGSKNDSILGCLRHSSVQDVGMLIYKFKWLCYRPVVVSCDDLDPLRESSSSKQDNAISNRTSRSHRTVEIWPRQQQKKLAELTQRMEEHESRTSKPHNRCFEVHFHFRSEEGQQSSSLQNLAFLQVSCQTKQIADTLTSFIRNSQAQKDEEFGEIPNNTIPSKTTTIASVASHVVLGAGHCVFYHKCLFGSFLFGQDTCRCYIYTQENLGSDFHQTSWRGHGRNRWFFCLGFLDEKRTQDQFSSLS